MKDSTLLLFALITGIIGLGILFAMSGYIEIEEQDLEVLDEYDYTKITGKVTKVKRAGNLTIITIQKPQYIDVVVDDRIDVDIGKNIEAYGDVSIYRDKKQIRAERILLE